MIKEKTGQSAVARLPEGKSDYRGQDYSAALVTSRPATDNCALIEHGLMILIKSSTA